MPAKMNNPAARLNAFVLQAKNLPVKIPVAQAWAILFNVAPDNTALIILGISEFIQLLDETRRAVGALDEKYDRELYLRPLDKVLSMFTNMSFGNPWSTVIGQIDDATLFGLSVCSDILSTNSQENPIGDETIRKTLSDVEALHKEVLESDLPQELKVFLVEQLEKLRNALLRYSFFGTKHLKAALESITGAVLLDLPKVAPFWDEPIVKRVWAVLTAVAILIQLTQGYQMLTGQIQALLSSGIP